MIVTNGYIASADHHLEGGEVLVEGPVPELHGLLLVALSAWLFSTHFISDTLTPHCHFAHQSDHTGLSVVAGLQHHIHSLNIYTWQQQMAL